MRSQNHHPFLTGFGIGLLLVLLTLLCWCAGATTDLFPTFLPCGAAPVAQDLGSQLPAGSLAIYERTYTRDLQPGRAVTFWANGDLLVGWLRDLNPATVQTAGSIHTPKVIMGPVRWSIGYLGAAVLLLQQYCWLVWGFTALVAAGLIWLAATAKRRRHNRKVKQMLETFERTARRYESDEEDF